MKAIGLFDSGYGGLTIFEKIRQELPDYDYIYLGDNARTPYGTRSFEVVYQFTREAVRHLFDEGCPLVILACNTASAKALRTIQQRDLPCWDDPARRVLGVIRPTVEVVDSLSRTKHIGVLGTTGTIASRSYMLELNKLFPSVTVVGEACPMWVPLVENNEFDSPGADYFVKQHIDRLLAKDERIDTIILGCTHYPLLIDKIRRYLPAGITLFSQVYDHEVYTSSAPVYRMDNISPVAFGKPACPIVGCPTKSGRIRRCMRGGSVHPHTAQICDIR